MRTKTLFYLVFGFAMAVLCFVPFVQTVPMKLTLLFISVLILFLGGFSYEIEERIDDGHVTEHPKTSEENKQHVLGPH